jgi:hypothetical protein
MCSILFNVLRLLAGIVARDYSKGGKHEALDVD